MADNLNQNFLNRYELAYAIGMRMLDAAERSETITLEKAEEEILLGKCKFLIGRRYTDESRQWFKIAGNGRLIPVSGHR